MKFKEGIPKHCEGLIKLLQMLAHVKKHSKQEDYKASAKEIIKILEKAADRIGNEIEADQDNEMNYPVAKIYCLSFSELLYNAAINLSKLSQQSFYSDLYFSPLYVLYSLAETHHPAGTGNYLIAMEAYIEKHNLIQISTDAEHKDQIDDYLAYIHKTREKIKFSPIITKNIQSQSKFF